MNTINENDITDEILDVYIEECRKELGDEASCNNLITLDLNKIKEGNVEEGRAGMLKWYKSGLARGNRLLCGKCGEVMDMYYTAQCFKCKDPKEVIDENGAINVEEACMLVKKREIAFSKDDFIDSVIDNFSGNDSYAKIDFDTDNQYHGIMNKYFESGKLWFISWWIRKS
jgi:hypothetical protein